MSLEYIRRTYGVPARPGMRVRYTDGDGVIWNGTITSAKRPHLRILVHDRGPGYRGCLIRHPTDNLENVQSAKEVPNGPGRISERAVANP